MRRVLIKGHFEGNKKINDSRVFSTLTLYVFYPNPNNYINTK